MPRGKTKATIIKLEDLTGALKMQRWNYCQAIAREIYLGDKTLEDLKAILLNRKPLCLDHQLTTH